MKIFADKKEYNFFSFFLPLVFFIAAVILFSLSSINLSPIVLLCILFIYAKSFKKIENLPSHLDLLLLVSIIILVFFCIFLIPSRIAGLPNDTLETILEISKVSLLGISAIGFAIIITLLFDNAELSFLFAIFIAHLGSTMEGGSLNIVTALFCGSVPAIMLSFRLRRRSQIVKSGFFSVIIFFIAYILESFSRLFFMPQLFKLTILSGIISSLIMMVVLPVIVIGILYIFEYIFRVVTNISLLELSDFNHPLLRKLILEAPGTYHHSLIVANLSETAAEVIGANSLLARVGAYYHDIGKLIKPNYFAENFVGYEDIHKDLKPSLSKLIILNHVKDGLDLAKKYHLNFRITDFINQHHGKTLIYYFYHRAKELEPDVHHEEEYRYPGPKPQSKETAIVALADTIEALSRTLTEPTPSRIEEMIREVVRKRFMDGELDESSLNFKELEKITHSFVRILNAMFHTRVNYPKEKD